MKTRLSRSILLILIAVASIGFVSCTTDPEKKKKDHVDRGNKYFNSGKFKEASIMYRMALKVDQRYGEAYYRLALSELRNGRIMEAFGALKRAAELQPNNVDAHAKLADLYLTAYLTNPTKNKIYVPELREISAKLLKNDPKSFDGLRINAFLLLADNRLKEAIEGFRAVAAIRPKETEMSMSLAKALVMDNQMAEAEKILTDLLAKEKTYAPAYDLLYLLAIKSNKVDEGESILKSKIENNPPNSQFMIQLAGHYFGAKKRPEMKATLDKLSSNSKDFPFGYREVGNFHAAIGEFDAALKAYTEGMNANPKQKVVYQKKMIEVLYLQRKPAEALRLVDDILKADEKDAEAVAMRAALWLESGQKDQLQAAISDLQSVLAKLPDNFFMRYNLGRALRARGDLDAARIQFQDAIKLRPDYVPPRLALAQMQLQKEEFNAAIQSTNEILAFQPNNPMARLLRASTLVGMKDYTQAKAELEAIIKSNPGFNDAKYQLALVHFHQKEYKKAEEIFRNLMAQNPPDTRGIMGLTEFYMATSQFDAALSIMRGELAKNPDRLDYRAAIANISARAGKYDDAMTELRTVLAKSPNNSDIMLSIGQVCKLKKDENCALEYYRKAAAVNDKDPRAQMFLAMQYDTLGMRAQARPVYTQILKVQPDNWQALNNMAFILAEEGKDLDQALTMVQRAKQTVPNEPNVADTLGWIYIKKNLSDSAIQIYKDLTVRDSGVSTWHYHLGMALYQHGDKLQAKKALEAALSKNPSKEESGKIKELLAKIG